MDCFLIRAFVMCATVFAGTVSSRILIALSWLIMMSRWAVVRTVDRGTVDGGMSNALWPGRSPYNAEPSGRWAFKMSTVWAKSES